jgi:hypothetical protein
LEAPSTKFQNQLKDWIMKSKSNHFTQRRLQVSGQGRFRGWFNVALFWFCLWLARISIFAAPRMEVEQPLWNFGAVTNLAELTHDFVVRNSGDAPLEISSVVSSCSACLRAGIGKNKIPPGGTTLLHSRLDLRQLSGAISRSILVDCNDPTNPSVPLELNGWVTPAYQMMPADLSLELSQGQSAATMEILPLIQLHADLSQVRCDDTNLEATVSPNPAGGFLLAVQARENLPRGNSVAQIIIRSADSNDLPCRVTVFIHHPPDLEVIPARLSFLPQAEPQMRILWLKQHGVAPMALLDAVPSSDKFHCEIDPDPSGINYRIYVNAMQLEAAVSQTNTLILKLADSRNGKEQAVTVPLVVEPQPE